LTDSRRAAGDPVASDEADDRIGRPAAGRCGHYRARAERAIRPARGGASVGRGRGRARNDVTDLPADARTGAAANRARVVCGELFCLPAACAARRREQRGASSAVRGGRWSSRAGCCASWQRVRQAHERAAGELWPRGVLAASATVRCVANAFDPEREASRTAPFTWRRARLGLQAAGQKLGASVFELPPGASSLPMHVHHANEELIVVRASRPTLRILEGERTLEARRGGRVPDGERIGRIAAPTSRSGC